MNTYRAKSKAAAAAFSDGVFEHEFAPAEERDWLSSGLIELVPRKYKVLSNNYEAGKQGDEVELALVVDIESALIKGGHLERVEPEPAPALEDDPEPSVKPKAKPAK